MNIAVEACCMEEKRSNDQGAPKLSAQIRWVLRRKHYSLRTERSYLFWIRNYVGFHNMRHPRGMGKHEIESFLTHLAVDRKNV